MRLVPFVIANLAFASPLLAHSQQIRVMVVEAHHGKPVVGECINISLGPWHGADLLASTDKDGLILLSLDHGEASVPPPVGRSCGGLASTKPVAFTPARISIVPDYYVSCQFSKRMLNDPAWLQSSPADRIPSFAVQDILATGLVATNSCTQFLAKAEPGKLILVVRKRSFLEGMRS